MSKGTASMGLKSRGKSHIRCRRCGRRSYHINKKTCASCGYGNSKKRRSYSWQKTEKK